jgi:hypothetical protein
MIAPTNISGIRNNHRQGIIAGFLPQIPGGCGNSKMLSRPVKTRSIAARIELDAKHGECNQKAKDVH